MALKYPLSKKENISNQYFDTVVKDPFQWLEDSNLPQTQKWILSQKNFGRDYLSKLPNRNKIYARLEELNNFQKEGTPFIMGKHTFKFKNNGLQNQDVLYLYNVSYNEWEVLFDPNSHESNGTLSIDNLSVSDDNRLLAFTVAYGGSDWKEIWVLNIETGTIVEQNLKWIKFSDIAWYKNGFYYNRYPAPSDLEYSEKNAQAKIYYHKVGTAQNSDKIIFEDNKYPERGYNIEVTNDKNFLFIYAIESTSGNAIFLKKLNSPDSIQRLYNDFSADRKLIDVYNEKLLFLTNANAPNQKVIAVDPITKKETTIIPEGKDLIESCFFFEKALVVVRLHQASNRLELYNHSGNKITTINLPGLGSLNGFIANRNSESVYFGYTSFYQPNQSFYLDLNNFEIRPIKSASLPFSPDDYITSQEWYKSKDGTLIPMFLTHKKGLDLTKPNPTILYGYGGFNISLTPSFNANRMYWLENGGILAIPNLRGGGEFGANWHEQGTILNKQNVFDDFIAAAEHLISQKITSSDLLTIHGGSNGGLLVGAVTNQRPELFSVAIPAVGVMDMLRYQNFTIGYYWATDYGTSTDSEEVFRYLYSYSPLHNIKSNSYPAILVTTAEKDDRVVPAHSFKYTAQMQTINPTGTCILRIEGEAGHGAGKPISKQLVEQTDMYAFILYHLRNNTIS